VQVKNAETPEKTRKAIYDELKDDLAAWMTTDRDLVWRPAIELTKDDHEFAARVLVPGVSPDEVEVLVAPEIMLIKGETHRGEPECTRILRSIKFPQPVDPDKVHAEMKDGMLCVKAGIAEASKASPLMLQAA
jgi:HSP20 family protein